MRFHDYLKSNRGARKAIAKRIGYHPTYLHAIATGDSAPSLALCRLIVKETKGKVTLVDLLKDIPTPAPKRNGGWKRNGRADAPSRSAATTRRRA